MSRKHFIKLAEMVRTLPVDPGVRYMLASRLGSICAEMNPRFDFTRFLAACGVKES